MTVISVTNQKGGAAKTTTVIELASNLSAQGYKVLAIDNDAQGSLTLAANPFGVPFYFGTVHDFYGVNSEEYFREIDSTAGPITIDDLLEIHGLSERERKIRTVTTCRWPIYRVGNDFDLIPAPKNQQLSDVERSMMHTKLQEAVARINEQFQYDFVIIDTPPALGILTVNALSAADYVLVPSQPESFAAEGIVQLNITVKYVIANSNPKLKYAGILLTKVMDNTNLHSSYIQATKNWGNENGVHVFESMIPNCIYIPESQYERKPLSKCTPKKKFDRPRKAYEAFTNEFMEVLKRA